MSFDRSTVSKVVETVEARMRDDPALGAAGGVRTWWFGTSCDERPEIDPDALPALLVSFSLGVHEPMDETGHKVPILVRCEMYHAGRDCRDTFDFWFAIVKSIFPPGSNEFLNLLRGKGAFKQLLTGPVPEPYPLDGGAACSYAVGEMTVMCRADT